VVGCARDAGHPRVKRAAALVACAAILAPIARAQDPSGSWRTLHTLHFRVHFRPAFRAVAGDAAREAERAYGLLARELHVPRGTIDLTLSDDVDVANGFTTVFPSNRIVVLLAPPATDPALQHYDDWLRLVITHELTHVFHLDRSASFWGGLQHLFGRVPGLFPNEYQPSWVIEGLAVYYESRLTAGGRVTGSFHTALLGADRAGGTSRGPWDALLFTRWPDGQMPYAYGSRFFAGVAHERGDSVIPRFVEATAAQTIPYRVGRQLRGAGASSDLSADWRRITRDAAATPDGPRGTLLADGLWSVPDPAASPDGRRVAFVQDDGKGGRRVVIADAATWRPLRRHGINSLASPGWLGDTLVVSQIDFTSRWRIRSDLYRWTPDGAWHRSTRAARLTEPHAGGGVFSAVVVSAGDNRPTLPGVPDPPGTTWGAIVPSPDGRWVAAARHGDGHWALVRWPAHAPDSVTVLFERARIVADPAWTQHGALLFVADPTGLPQVYRWTDSGAVRLTADPAGARHPAPLADGTLVYATLGARGWQLRRATPLVAAAEPGAAPAPFDTAPAVATRETGYTAWPSLRPHFWIPTLLTTSGAGTFVGAVTAGGDALDRDYYVVQALAAPDTKRAAGAFWLVDQRLGNPTLDISGSSDWSFVGTSFTGVAVSERDQDAALGLTFVRQRWRTFMSLRAAGEYEGRRFAAEPDTPLVAVCTGCTNRDLVGGSVSVGLARAFAGPLSVSPENGFSVAGLVRRREQQGSTRWANEVRARAGLYLRVPGPGGFAHSVLALRLAAGATAGPITKTLGVGGVSSGTLALGFGQSFGTARAFPVRGYAGGTLRGRRAATASVEYRMPLALIGKGVGHLPVGADKLSLSLFGDAGDAWEPGAQPRLTHLYSAGAELVTDVNINYDFPLRLRLGAAEPIAPLPGGGRRRLQAYLGFSSDF
jgi:hypothetical protein